MQCPAPKLWCRYLSIFKPAKTVGLLHDLKALREMYIVAERHVIIWREAALASYILQKGLGFAVGSLRELPARIAEVTDEDYAQMLHNAREEKKRLTAGKNLEEAVGKTPAIVEIRA